MPQSELAERYASRKLAVTVGAVALFSALLWAGRVSDSVYADLITITLSGYFVGNVGEHFAKRRSSDGDR